MRLARSLGVRGSAGAERVASFSSEMEGGAEEVIPPQAEATDLFSNSVGASLEAYLGLESASDFS